MAELTQDSITPIASPVSARGAQILVLLVTAALTYGGLSRLMPGSERSQTSDRIQAIAAAPMAAPMSPVSPPGPRVMETLPLQTEIIHSPRHAISHRRHRLLKKPQASLLPEPAQAQPTQEHEVPMTVSEAVRLGLVPETIVLPKREAYQVSSLVLVKPRSGAKKPMTN